MSSFLGFPWTKLVDFLKIYFDFFVFQLGGQPGKVQIGQKTVNVIGTPLQMPDLQMD